ncbi:MAG: RNA 2',3'-cyclic phosphodiesterase [Desulfamplus sp.]|nr:RNA 2',3'-cyclic phosphodiesterase [Desulfamplus sp.]
MRLFTAIPIPRHLINELNTMLSNFPELHRVNHRDMHITLQFFGEVSTEAVGGLITVLKKIPVSEMTLELDGTGFFPDKRHPAIFWAGIKDNPDLSRLKLDMERILETLCFPADNRTFTPHVTLLRIREWMSRKSIDMLNDAFLRLPLKRFRVRGFGLFRSELLPSGARHTVIKTYESNNPN